MIGTLAIAEVHAYKVGVLRFYDLLQIADNIPEKSKKVARPENRDDELNYPESVDDIDLRIYACVIFKVLDLNVSLVQFEFYNLLLQLLVEDGLDVLLEFARTQQIVTFGDTDDFDGVEKAAQLASVVEDLRKRDNSDRVVHESSLEIIKCYLVQVSYRLPRSFVVILQEKLEATI